MVDKGTIYEIFGCLMKHPQYLSETDRYLLKIDDFSTNFERYIFTAIFNLYKDGAQVLNPVDIDNYFQPHKAAKACFESNNGIEYLQDAIEFSEEENFPFYYKRLKKFNALKDLKKLGYDTSSLYEEDLTNPKAKEINERFENLSVQDMFSEMKKKLMKVETSYLTGDSSETHKASKGINDLLEDLKIKPEVGLPLQGQIFNTITRGARKTKFYIRSASSGTGKTRAAVGDACNLAYPVIFNTNTWRWEPNSSQEKILFIATEQEDEEIQTLILSFLSGINEEKILNNDCTEEEYKIIAQAAEVMKKYEDNFYLVRMANPSVEQIKAVVRQNWILNDIDCVFYDYIFSSPSLLNEFRDLKVREDVALGLLSTALKDLAVEMNLFVMSSTQTNAKSDEQKGLKDESVIRGSRAIIDKADLAAVISRVTKEDLDMLNDVINDIGIIPNQVMDIYKNRRGRYTNVKIWSNVDLGTCRKVDVVVTDERYRPIESFRKVNYLFTEENEEDTVNFLSKLNGVKR